MHKPLLLILLIISPASAQTVDATRMGEPVNLAGDWLFHAGDDARWSQPDLPDADWRVVSTNVGWFEHGRLWNGYYWYRLHVKLAHDHPPLQLLFDYMGNPYEAYVNGTLVGRFGRFPPNPSVMRPLIRSFAIPSSILNSSDSLVIAIRFWTPPVMGAAWGGLRTSRPVVLGAADAVQNEYDRIRSEILYPWLPDICVAFVSLVLALGLFILFWFQRHSPEYLWIASYLLVITAWNLFLDLQTILPVSVAIIDLLDVALINLAEAILLSFVFAFLKQPMPLWVRLYQISLPLQIILPITKFWTGTPSSAATIDLIAVLWTAPYSFLLPGIVLWRYLRGLKEAGLLILPLLLITFNSMLNEIGELLFEVGLRDSADDVVPPLNVGEIPIYAGQIGWLLFVISIGALVLYRFHSTSQHQARAQSELEAARSMQEVMVPQQLHRAAGFAIQSAYIPAQEVGGDFFQLFPSDESLLVVIGDVSGKGIKAAMLVSVIIGVLHRTVELTRSPAQILRDLNRCLLGQTDGKFATCCCALMCADGRVFASNAGHLSPYCDGEEIEFPVGFPLGISAEAEYDEIELTVPPGKRWLFISDGVVEARSKTGELYGFERTRGISVLAVSQIAATAQQFGQEDDITVLGIERQAVAFA